MFTGTAIFAALAGGVAGLALGSSGHTAPTTPSVGAVQTEWVPAVVQPATTPTAVAPAPVAQPVVTRTVTIVRHETTAPTTPKAGKPVSTPNEPTEQTVEQSAPAEPVAAVEVDPTPSPTLPPSNGAPSSMHGQPDPTLGGVTPGDPTQTPPPLDR